MWNLASRRRALRPLLWEVATAYVPGELVYYQGECYAAIAANTGVLPSVAASWRKQAFPAVLERAIKLVAIADALREDENLTKAAMWDAQSGQALYEALDRATPAYRTRETFEVLGR